MRYIKNFNESTHTRSENEIIETLKSILQRDDNVLDRIRIRPDGTVDVIKGSIYIHDPKMTELPLKFGEVEMSFELIHCDELTTLKGSPTHCRNFRCSVPKIGNLVGGPEYVVELYDVRHSPLLTSLEGFPKRTLQFSSSPDKNLYDPRGLKDCDVKYLDFHQYCPILELIELFNQEDFYYKEIPVDDQRRITKIFIESLDYGYIRGNEEEGISINLFRLKEALSEFGIENPTPFPEFSETRLLRNYYFIGEGGKIVDFDGNPPSFFM